jgi:hypothetical protein
VSTKSNVIRFPYSRVLGKATPESFGRCLTMVSDALEKDIEASLNLIKKEDADQQGWQTLDFSDLS